MREITIPNTEISFIKLLRKLFIKHPIGKIINFKSNSIEQNGYAILSIILYLFNIYQNVKSSITFYKNMKKIKSELKLFKQFIIDSVNLETQLLTITEPLKSYNKFNKTLHKNIKHCNNILNELLFIGSKTSYIESFLSMGQFLKAYYYIYTNNEVSNSIDFLISFNSYIDNITGLQKTIQNKHLTPCKINNKKPTKFIKAYYGLITNNISNSYNLKNNFIITGPNASGKTTLLKTTLINIILCQQVGYGFYKSAQINLYKQLHCYLNIPDTSDRDSLFQAEARRCKKIINNIKNSEKDSRIFCIFDELYSGTNPYEATASAQSFLEYLSSKKNVTYMITTHYLDLCKNIRQKKTKNYNMEIISKNNELQYTYKLKKGINETKGGVSVLKKLEYPTEIIKKTEQILSNSFSEL